MRANRWLVSEGQMVGWGRTRDVKGMGVGPESSS